MCSVRLLMKRSESRLVPQLLLLALAFLPLGVALLLPSLDVTPGLCRPVNAVAGQTNQQRKNYQTRIAEPADGHQRLIGWLGALNVPPVPQFPELPRSLDRPDTADHS